MQSGVSKTTALELSSVHTNNIFGNILGNMLSRCGVGENVVSVYRAFQVRKHSVTCCPNVVEINARLFLLPRC